MKKLVRGLLVAWCALCGLVVPQQVVVADPGAWFRSRNASSRSETRVIRLRFLGRIGTAVQIDGRLGRGDQYFGACSFGHAGIAIPGGRSVPLSLDPLLMMSLVGSPLFQNFSGTTSQVNGAFSMTLNVPNIAGLKGVRIFTSAVSVNNGVVSEIAPDLHVTFQ